MRFVGWSNNLRLKCHERISKGDIVTRLWKNYCRKAKSSDKNISLIALDTGVIGQIINVHQIKSDEVYTQ